MGLPSQRRTSTSKKQRASHFAMKKVQTAKCADCGASIRPHHACPKCGKYKGKKVVDVAKRAARHMRKPKA